MLVGCSRKDDVGNGPDPGPGPGPVAGSPVETNPANSNYGPAFIGQTRIAGVKTTTPIEAKVITSSLSAPLI